MSKGFYASTVSALLLIAAAFAPAGAAAASLDSDFDAAIERLLMNMKEGAVSQMSTEEKRELVTCVQGVFASVPDEKKQYIASAKDHAELRARFDEVGLENDGRLKQQVRDECA